MSELWAGPLEKGKCFSEMVTFLALLLVASMTGCSGGGWRRNPSQGRSSAAYACDACTCI